MADEPRLEYRKEQPYVAVRAQVAIPFRKVLPGLWAEAGDFIKARRLTRVGAPFIRYLTTDMADKLDIEVGYPIASATTGDERVTAGVLPAGRYAVLLYLGDYKNLVKVTAGLLEWAEKNNIAWEIKKVDEVEWWAGRLEWYLNDPDEEKDPQKWQTELAFLTANALDEIPTQLST